MGITAISIFNLSVPAVCEKNNNSSLNKCSFFSVQKTTTQHSVSTTNQIMELSDFYCLIVVKNVS